ncbi:MAG: DNA-binding protein WhiA [Candidatus Eremiobacteraeota bacterium]|nr:DNA-binding protein WhiA [Candidatus Eremiobacteraeota bacterium]
MASSLSADAKDALARDVPEAPHCRQALARGLATFGSDGARFRTQRNAVARLFWSLLRERKAHPIRKVAGARLYRAPTYEIALPPDGESVAAKPTRKCDRVMEIRAAFLACGSLSAGAQGYHLEFVVDDGERTERLAWLLKSLGLAPKRATRKKKSVLYFKEFDAIEDVLSTIGAFGAVLRIEDVRAYRETKNRIHRLVNTEAANVERAASAAAAQRRTIEDLANAYGLRKLSPALREIAELRLRHPSESLAELGARCNPPASKSAVNGRLGALARLARKVRGAVEKGPRNAQR